MEYLYNRRDELKQQIRSMERFVFNRDCKVTIQILRALLKEVEEAIRHLEHEV